VTLEEFMAGVESEITPPETMTVTDDKVGEKDVRAEQKTEILGDLENPPAAME
jgi:hypothetical protein